MTKSQRVLGWCCLFLLCSALGCRERRRGTSQGRSDGVVAKPAATPVNLLSPGQLVRFREAVSRQWGAELRVLRVELAPARITLQLQPSATEGAAEYSYTSGGFEGPFALALRGSGALEQNVFAFSAVEWENLPSLLELARTRVDAQQGQAERVLVRRNLPQDDSIGIRVYVKSPFRDGQVDADARGRPIEPGRYP